MVVSADVRDASPLTSEQVREQRALVERAQQGRIAPRSTGPTLVSSIWVDRRRYDSWRTVEILDGLRAAPELASQPLVTWVLIVHGPSLEYLSLYAGPPFAVDGLEQLAAERAVDRLAVLDAQAYDGRQLELAPYRRWAAARPGEAAAHYELALMIWFQHYSGVPGPVLDAEPPLRRALERSPRAHAVHGLLGEVLLQSGRSGEAAQAFQEAARLRPRQPRYLYCASVALEKAGDAAAARRALEAARAVAGPRLKDRFTPGSNPLEDYRYALLKEVTRLRTRREGIVPVSDQEP